MKPRLLEWNPDRVFRAYFHEVWRLLRRLGVDETEVDDAVQEVFLVVHRRWDDFQGRSSVRTWVFGIALRTARAWRRRARFRRIRFALGLEVAVEPQDPVTPEDLFDRALAAAALQRCLSRLSDSHREIFVCVMLEGLSIVATARLLNLRLPTAYSRFAKARGRFQKLVSTELSAADRRSHHAGS